MAFRRAVKRGCAVHPSATVRPLQEKDSLIQFMRLEDALIVNDDFAKQITDGQQTEQPAYFGDTYFGDSILKSTSQTRAESVKEAALTARGKQP